MKTEQNRIHINSRQEVQIMKEKFMRFMQGRYGVDQLSKALLVIGLISILLASFFRGSLVGIIFSLCRMVPDHLLLFQNVFKECIEALCGESGVSCKVIQDPLLFWQSRKICSGRESSIIFINARDAVRRSGFQEAKERLRSVVRSVAQSSLKRAEKV